MCEKKPNENVIVFFFRQLAEKPLEVVCTLAIGGLVFLYSDMREFMQSQTAAFNEFTTTLKEQNLRLQHLEEYHLQELSKREQTAQGTQTTESK
jgi:hypothetical protein